MRMLNSVQLAAAPLPGAGMLINAAAAGPSCDAAAVRPSCDAWRTIGSAPPPTLAGTGYPGLAPIPLSRSAPALWTPWKWLSTAATPTALDRHVDPMMAGPVPGHRPHTGYALASRVDMGRVGHARC